MSASHNSGRFVRQTISSSAFLPLWNYIPFQRLRSKWPVRCCLFAWLAALCPERGWDMSAIGKFRGLVICVHLFQNLHGRTSSYLKIRLVLFRLQS